MTPVPHNRAGDKENHDHEREWNGPSKSEWDALVSQVDATHKLVTTLDVALFGSRDDKLDDAGAGGIFAEVRVQRELRTSARNSARWALGIAIGTAIAVFVEWVMDKIRRG